MSYSSPVNPYVPLPPGGGQMGVNPQPYGYPGTGYAQNAATPMMPAPMNTGALPMPPDSLGGPGQNANLSATDALNRESQLDELATTRAQIISQRMAMLNSTKLQMQDTVMGIVSQDMDYSNAVIANGDKAAKGAAKDAQGA